MNEFYYTLNRVNYTAREIWINGQRDTVAVESLNK